MSNGSQANTHVTKVEQRDDDTIVVHIQTDSFKPGQEVEVSAYLSQGDAYAIYNDKKRIPLPDPTAPTDPNAPKPPAQLHVELQATKLDEKQEVTVVTRITEVWPTVLRQDSGKLDEIKAALYEYGAPQGLKAVWTYQDAAGKGQGGS
jgi:hypothetical protein